MKKSKTQKGITLVALIITIVVLLILATVAISSIQKDDILQYANDAASKYNQAQVNEQETLDGYLGFLEKHELNSKKFSTTGTINGEAYGAYNPVIPKGFAPIDTATSSWNAEDLEAEVKKGLVISDGTSEFVWIPVAELNGFARLQDGSDTNYEGVLYDFSGTTATEKTGYGQNTKSYKEPSNLDKSYDNTTNLSTWTEEIYQESFNAMVESVAKYKGFYIGRYETSLNGSVAQSKSGEKPMNHMTWYRMYENSKTYSTSNSSLGVVSEMIWGCQWDAMLKLILTGPDASHVTAKTNVGHTGSEFTNQPYKTGGTNYTEAYTGSTTYNDIASNIYDLEGNVQERTQEAKATDYRVIRGGSCGKIYDNSNDSPNDRHATTRPIAQTSILGSRMSLYVEV